MTPRQRSTHDQPTRHDRLDALSTKLQAGVAAIQSSPDFQRYLRRAAHFHTYSLRNVLLITMQCPHATHVAGYKTWQTLGRQVRRGERGITIYAPMPYTKQTDEDEEQTGIAFRTATVFDISQTDGEPLPDPVEAVTLTGTDGTALYGVLEGVTQRRGLRLTTTDPDDPPPDRNVCYSYARNLIYVKPNPPTQMAKTLIHELAHASDPDLYACPRREAETVAEAVAFTVAAHFGIDASSYSFPYIAYWVGSENGTTILTRVIQRTHTIARQIISEAEAVIAAAAEQPVTTDTDA